MQKSVGYMHEMSWGEIQIFEQEEKSRLFSKQT